MLQPFRVRVGRITALAIVIGTSIPDAMAPPQDTTPASQPAAQVASDAAPPLPAFDLSAERACRVVDVLSGDVIVAEIDGRKVRVRLVGADAPGPAQPKFEAARQFLTNLLKGESVYLRSAADEQSDAFGRRLAFVHRAPDGLFVDLELVRQGYARSAGQLPADHAPAFSHWEGQARRAEKGVWAAGPAVATGEGAEGAAAKPETGRAATSEKKNGGEERKAEAASADDEAVVYVTETGRKYHKADCSFLRSSKKAITLKEARERGLTPCSRCFKEGG